MSEQKFVPKSDGTFDYGRNKGREFVKTQADFASDVVGSKQSAGDERIRNVERGRYADFFRRRFGRAITEADYPETLREGGAA